jgi:membrane protein DedA with SNARE-associated domain
VRRDAPTWLLASTIACFILVNVLIAQGIIAAFYPTASTRLGPAGLAVLCVLLVATSYYAARGWRSYFRRPPA